MILLILDVIFLLADYYFFILYMFIFVFVCFSIMAAINNLEVTVRNQNSQIEEMQQSLMNIMRNNTPIHTHFEVFVIIAVVAALQALFLYYK